MKSVNIVEEGFCIGCGACAYASKSNMKLNEYGEFVPEEDPRNNELASKVCPSLNPDLNEDVLAGELYKSHSKYDNHIGYHISCYGAYVKSNEIRENSTSGGFGTWLGIKLMNEGMIDGVIHAKAVNPKENNGILFDYKISKSIEEVIDGAKTRYHVLEMSKVLEQVKNNEGRYLFIGVPCFVKAIRRLQKIDPTLKERIPYTASLVCGHYKSLNWTLSLAWGAGMKPKDLKKFQYRTKGDGIDPRSYVFRASSFSGETIQEDSSKVIGGKFNAGAMMPNACNFCDDVVGETADITIGDAWLPKFDTNQSGTNLLIIRNKNLQNLILKSENLGEVYLEEISTKDAINSQSGGFRQRREGLSYRLAQAEKRNKWVPKKRIKAQEFKISLLRKAIYNQRMRCSSLSRESFLKALKSNNYSYYALALNGPFKWLRFLEVISSFRKILYIRIIRFVKKVYK